MVNLPLIQNVQQPRLSRIVTLAVVILLALVLPLINVLASVRMVESATWCRDNQSVNAHLSTLVLNVKTRPSTIHVQTGLVTKMVDASSHTKVSQPVTVTSLSMDLTATKLILALSTLVKTEVLVPLSSRRLSVNVRANGWVNSVIRIKTHSVIQTLATKERVHLSGVLLFVTVHLVPMVINARTKELDHHQLLVTPTSWLVALTKAPRRLMPQPRLENVNLMLGWPSVPPRLAVVNDWESGVNPSSANLACQKSVPPQLPAAATKSTKFATTTWNQARATMPHNVIGNKPWCNVPSTLAATTFRN